MISVYLLLDFVPYLTMPMQLVVVMAVSMAEMMDATICSTHRAVSFFIN